MDWTKKKENSRLPTPLARPYARADDLACDYEGINTMNTHTSTPATRI